MPVAKKFLPFGEFMPDQPDFNNPGSANIKNVVPLTAGSYGGMPTMNIYPGGSLTARCQGSYSLQDTAGNTYVFAGDASRLYLLKPGQNFTDVSKSAGGPYTTGAVPSGFWDATSFGLRVIFTNYSDPIQTFLVATDSAFSDLSAAAPKARYCAAIRDFLMVANTDDGTNGAQPQRCWWSAIGDPTSWPTPGTNAASEVQSDFQDLEQTDLGQISGLIGGYLSSADGAVFCERGVYRVAYAGSPAIFDFSVAEGASGTQSPLSVVTGRLASSFGVRSGAYYLGENGFNFFDGALVIPIGAGKVDKFFYKDADASFLAYVIGIADPINKLIFWAYCGPQSGGFLNRLLIYNWELNRWAFCDLSLTPVEWLTRSLSLGYTLDQLDALGNLDTLPFSLDSRLYTGGKAALSAFNSQHALAYFTGTNMAPTVETTEAQLAPGRLANVLSARPIVDGGSPSIAVGRRNRTLDSVVYQAAVPVNVLGECPQRTAGRYVRFQLTIPISSVFTHLQGVEATFATGGVR